MPSETLENIKTNIINSSTSAKTSSPLSNSSLCLYPTQGFAGRENTFTPVMYDSKFELLGYKEDKIPIVSNFSKTFFEKFNHIPTQHNYSFEDFKDLFDSCNFRNTFTSSSQNNSLLKLSTLSFTSLQKENLPFETYDVLSLKAPCSGFQKELKHNKFTKKKYVKGDSAFLPVLIPLKIYDFNSSSFYDAYLFTFNLDINHNKIKKYKKITNYLASFVKNGYLYDSLYFYNTDLFNTLTNTDLLLKIKKHNCSKNFIEIAEKEPRTFENLLLPLSKPIEKADFLSTSKIFKYPSKIISKEFKLTKKLTEVNNFFTHPNSDNNLRIIKRQINAYQSKIDDIDNRIRVLSEQKIAQKNGLEEFLQKKQNLSNNINIFFDNLKTNTLKYKAFAKKEIQLKEHKKELKKTLSSTEDLTLSNLLDDFEIIDIIFEDGSKWTDVKDFSPEYLTKHKIKEIFFATKKPSKVTLVNGKASVVAGPFLLKANKNALYIKAKDFTTNLGIDKTRNNTNRYGRAYIHPHAATRNIDTNFFSSWSSACLGEASGILYKAFAENNLKMILISVNCWLTSANQVDHWGKNYIYFTSWEDYLNVSSLQQISDETLQKNKVILNKYLSRQITHYNHTPLKEDTNSSDLPSEDSQTVLNNPDSGYVPYVSTTWS
jgi:hypothetical protein